MNAEELLTTTRGVRKRLDTSRPVPDDLIRECVRCALQAPAGSNLPRTRFVVVRDPTRVRAVAGIYRKIYDGEYRASPGYIGRVSAGSPEEQRHQERSAQSADALSERLADAPVIVIACLAGVRIDGAAALVSASLLGGALPAMWSFMLAARARGLGTCWTTMHLKREAEVAEILGIPFDTVQQVCLTPVAYTLGASFRPALRPDPEDVIHWDGWEPEKPMPSAGQLLGQSPAGT